MITKIRTLRCPHCNYLIDSGEAAYVKSKYESPFKTCPKCHEKYIDKECIELAIHELTWMEKMPFSKKLFESLIAILGIGVFLLLVGIGKFSIPFFVIPLVIAGGACLFWPSKLSRLEEERQNSEKRLSDPAYAHALKAAGYPVPLKYLDPIKHEKITELKKGNTSTCERCGIYLRPEQFRKINDGVYCNSCYNTIREEQK